MNRSNDRPQDRRLSPAEVAAMLRHVGRQRRLQAFQNKWGVTFSPPRTNNIYLNLGQELLTDCQK